MNAGHYGWLFCWIAMVVFSLILQYLAPVIILPLFNKFTPLPEGSLRSTIFDYAQLSNFRIQGIYTMDGSKRSTKLNAFFVGFGRFKLKHIPKMAFASILQTGIMLYLLSFFLNVQSIA